MSLFQCRVGFFLKTVLFIHSTFLFKKRKEKKPRTNNSIEFLDNNVTFYFYFILVVVDVFFLCVKCFMTGERMNKKKVFLRQISLHLFCPAEKYKYREKKSPRHMHFQ